MNIFYLDKDPRAAAIAHCDKHVVKMILETAQLLSTAHRVLDGEEYIDASSGRKLRRWRILDSDREERLYKATHVNHPSAIWVRANNYNYMWAVDLLFALCEEYTYRYGKHHKTYLEVSAFVAFPPDKILEATECTEIPQAMPDECKVPGDAVAAYRKYYIQHKSEIATWTRRPQPEWYK